MQKILICQQNGSGNSKIAGINRFGGPDFVLEIFDINVQLPPLLDDTTPFLPEKIDADLVLDYFTHQDLSDDLSLMCQKRNIPVVASGKKIARGDAICPPVCCALAKYDALGNYGKLFGAPKLAVEIRDDKLHKIDVLRGAPCGATWLAAQKCRDMPVQRALHRFGLEVQFFCTANPAGWDPIYGKSPVHLAADVHSAALKACLKKCAEQV